MKNTLRIAALLVVILAGTSTPAEAHRTPKPHNHGVRTGAAALNRLMQPQCSPAVAGACHVYRPVFMERDSAGRWVLRVDCGHADVYCGDEGA